MPNSTQSIPIATHDPRSPRAVVGIRPADLLRSVYVVGKTGTGKSTFLENLLLRSADAGFGAALIDPHGDLFSRVLENLPSRHWNRVAILRPADAGRAGGREPSWCSGLGLAHAGGFRRHRGLSHALGANAFRPAVGACASQCGPCRSRESEPNPARAAALPHRCSIPGTRAFTNHRSGGAHLLDKRVSLPGQAICLGGDRPSSQQAGRARLASCAPTRGSGRAANGFPGTHG